MVIITEALAETRYKVERGDTKESIANKFYIDPSYLMYENKQFIDSVLHPGYILKIPDSEFGTIQPYITYASYIDDFVKGKNTAIKLEYRLNEWELGGTFFGVIGYANMSDAYLTSGQYSLDKHDTYGGGLFMDYKTVTSITKLSAMYLMYDIIQKDPLIKDEVKGAYVRAEVELTWRTPKKPRNKRLTIYGNFPINPPPAVAFSTEPLSFMNIDQVGFDFDADIQDIQIMSWQIGFGAVAGMAQYNHDTFGDVVAAKVGGKLSLRNHYRTVISIDFGKKIAYRNSNFNSIYLSLCYEAGPDDLANLWDWFDFFEPYEGDE